MTTTSGLAGILSFIFVVLMTLGFLRSIHLTRDGFFADEEDEDDDRNDHSLSGQTPEEFRRHQEADLEAGMGRRPARRRLREQEDQEDLEGLFWDVELVFPGRGQNNPAYSSSSAHRNTAVGTSAGNGRWRSRLSELLFRRGAATTATAAAAPLRTAGFPPGDSVEGENSVEQGVRQGSGTGMGGGGVREHSSGALDPRTRKLFVHFVAKAGDGFAPPPAGAPAFTTTTPSAARVAASSVEQGGAGEVAEPSLRPPDGCPRRRPVFSSSGSEQPCHEEETKNGLVEEIDLSSNPPSPSVPGEDGASAARGRRRWTDNGNPLEGAGDVREEWKDGEQHSAVSPAAPATDDPRTHDAQSPGRSERRPTSPGEVADRSIPDRNAPREAGAPAAGNCVSRGRELERIASPAQAEATPERRAYQEEKQEEKDGSTCGGRDGTPAAGADADGSEPSGGTAALAREEGPDGEIEDEGMQVESVLVGGASLAAGDSAGASASVGADTHGPASPIARDGDEDAGAARVTPEVPGRVGVVLAHSGSCAEVSRSDVVASASDRRPGSLRLSFNRSLEGKKLSASVRRRRRGSSVACPVCLDVFQEHDVITLVTCGHAFHWKCVEPWLERSARCPCCRQDLNALTANLLKSTDQGSVDLHHSHPNLGGVGSSGSNSSNNSSGGWPPQQQEHQRPPLRSETPPAPPPRPPPLPPPARRQAAPPAVLDRHNGDGHSVATVAI
eukprot:g8480.t1